MPAANASALASASPLSATNDLTIAHVMWRYDADAGFVVIKNTSDRNKAFFIREPYLSCDDVGGISNGDGTSGITGRLAMCKWITASWLCSIVRHVSVVAKI
jgi:hypothetical protein